MSTAPATIDGPLLTADGVPLKDSLQRSLRRSRFRALMLVLPPLLFLIFLFVIPIGNMLTRSVDDNLINDVIPLTFEAFETWDKTSEPSEEMFEAFYSDLKNADKTDIGKASVRMNYALPGWRSLIKPTANGIPGPEYPRSHRPNWTIHGLCDLLVTHPIQFSQHDRSSQIVRQGLYSSFQCLL